MDRQALQPAQLVRALAAACCLVALGGCSGDGEERPKGKGTPPAALEPAGERLPAAARRDARTLLRSLGDPGAKLAWYRGRRHRVLETLAPDAVRPSGDGPVVVATFEGRLNYRRGRTPPGEPKSVRGRFAYSTYSAGNGAPLDLGVLPRVPRAAR